MSNPEKNTYTIIFIGPQGSGKGTQAKILKKKINAEYIETGGLLREISKKNEEFGRKLKEIVDSGRLIDDQMWGEVMTDKLKSLHADASAIIDGSPRRMSQAHILIDIFNDIGRHNVSTIYITLPREESIRRLMHRLVCEDCKIIVNNEMVPDELCSECGGKMTHRTDDLSADVINERLDLYQRETLPVVNYLRDVTILHEINGMGSMEEVAARIDQALGLTGVA